MPMAREQKFDLSEMAIVTYLQAKAYGKPLMLLPATMMGRFQHGTLLYNSERGRCGRRIFPAAGSACGLSRRPPARGSAAFSGRITGSISAQVKWVTFEDAHVAEYRDPPGVERAAAGKDITQDADRRRTRRRDFRRHRADDPRLKSVIPDPEAAAKEWYRKHGTVPINHMVVVKESLAKSDPAAVREVFRMLLDSKKAAGLPKAGAIDFVPFGFDAVRPSLELMSAMLSR